MLDTRCNIAVYNGLQKLDCGLVVGSKQPSLGAPLSEGIEAKDRAAQDLKYDATTKLQTRLRGVSYQPYAHSNMRLCTTATGRALSKVVRLFKELIVMPIYMCALTGFVVRARFPSPPCPPSAFALLRTRHHMKEVIASEARLKTNH
eukprot:4026244-Pleurochrysis_carterae.AAC.4